VFGVFYVIPSRGKFYDDKPLKNALVVFVGGFWRILAAEFEWLRSGP
jgi:hypothetical protein